MRKIIGRRFVDIVAGYDELLTVRFMYAKNSANKVADRVVERAAKDVKYYFNRLLDNKSPAIS
jgi:hypothetical protein